MLGVRARLQLHRMIGETSRGKLRTGWGEMSQAEVTWCRPTGQGHTGHGETELEVPGTALE